jgi:hypothetical protein
MAGAATIFLISRETKITTEEYKVHKDGLGHNHDIKFNLCDLCDLLLDRFLNSCVLNPKNKKSASRIEALFPSGGKLLPSLIRAHLRQGRIDIHTTTVPIEAHNTVYQGEDGVIPTKPNILSRQKLSAALANNDISSNDLLATELLHAQAFADAVASVLDAALTFLMCHTL